MANTFKIKRSSVEGKQPLTTDLQLGELAINTYDGKLFLKKNNGTDAIVEVGGKQGYYVKNQTGSTITKGTLVRFNGTLGSSGKLLIAPFIANNTYPSEYVMGIVEADIATGGDGFVIHKGQLLNYNTSSWADGAILYANASTAGALTSTQPLAPNNKVMVAAVVHSHATAGILEIRVTQGSKLNNDELVELSSLTNGQALVYNSTTARFENQTISGTSVTVGTAAPSSPSAGALWWNSEEGKLKIYYTDANTSQWVDANTGTIGPQGIQGIQGPTGADGAAGPGVPTGGTTGQVLTKSSSTDYATQWATPEVAAGVTEIKVTSYSSAGSGTFTRDSNCLYAQVIVTGGGGGGGGADSDGTSASAAGGGGAAGTTIKWFMAVELGTTATYTVGNGGSAGSTSGGNGGTGSNSTFTPTGLGAPLVANGGGGGTGTGSAYANNSSAFSGGLGSSATGGDFNHTGVDGGYGFGAVSTTTSVAGGNGGASFWGGGANGPTRNTAGSTAGQNATFNGAGGSGGVNTNATSGVVGGTGATGEILIIEYLAA